MKESILSGKSILAVDDEPDVLEVLEEEIRGTCPDCTFDRATTFEEASQRLASYAYDLIILDIMGVRGFDLLERAVSKKLPVAMLTAHALTPEDTMKSYRCGASFYVPKDKIGDLVNILSGVLEASQKGKNTWIPFMNWAEGYYNAKFGPKWQ
ncbi:MAG: response regulator, partial [Deltaproteobacteria bacterium]